MCFLCADNQFRMSILERLEQMERRMAEMAARDNNNQQQQQHHHHHQHGSQLATPPPPPLPEDHEQVRMLTNRNTDEMLPEPPGQTLNSLQGSADPPGRSTGSGNKIYHKMINEDVWKSDTQLVSRQVT